MRINLPQNKFVVLEDESCGHKFCGKGMCSCDVCTEFMLRFYARLARYGVPRDACSKCFGTQHPVLTKKQHDKYRKAQAQARAASVAVPAENKPSRTGGRVIKVAATADVLLPVTEQPKTGGVVDCTSRHTPRRMSGRPSSTSSSSGEEERHPKPGTIKGGIAALIAKKGGNRRKGGKR